MKKEIKKAEPCMKEEDGIRCMNSTYGASRGLCQTHYVNYRYHVKKGHTTWKQLEKEGKCLKKLSQAEKNMNQMHPHRKYKARTKKKIDPKMDF